MVRAEEIYNKLGHDCIVQVKADPSVLRKIKGLHYEHQQAIKNFLCAKETKEKSTLELQSLLKGWAFSIAKAKKIYTKFYFI
ncbi:MAG: hypothetical protein FWG73_00335 [Planctomycetaceae bacterium]|nr:hypothetical protein [Planctomycetaceae bacterium]